MKVVDVRDFCIPSDENDYDELVAFADQMANVLQFDAVPINVFDKIIAELIEEKECAYADFEKYKVEYLGQSWDDVYDSLPQDDFRYGMERCIEIIGKYKKKSEG